MVVSILYGNNNYVVNWWNDGYDIKQDKLNKLAQGLCLPSNSKPKNMDYYFKESIYLKNHLM